MKIVLNDGARMNREETEEGKAMLKEFEENHGL